MLLCKLGVKYKLGIITAFNFQVSAQNFNDSISFEVRMIDASHRILAFFNTFITSFLLTTAYTNFISFVSSQ